MPNNNNNFEKEAKEIENAIKECQKKLSSFIPKDEGYTDEERAALCGFIIKYNHTNAREFVEVFSGIMKNLKSENKYSHKEAFKAALIATSALMTPSVNSQHNN